MIPTRRLDLRHDLTPAQLLQCLASGGLAAVPTETVYGLAADATNGDAVARIFEAKGRPTFNPLISHVADLAMAREHALFDETALRLAAHFWPGPLTMVLPLRPGSAIHPLALGGLSTVALRMPQGPLRDAVAALGRPVAAPSANRSGRVSPTDADHVLRTLEGRIGLVVDGGPTAQGLESTIVRAETDRIVLLRPGTITAADLEAATGLPVVRRADGERIDAPGQLLSHYAPHGSVRLNADTPRAEEYWIAFGAAQAAGHPPERVFQLSARGDLREAASRLFAALSAFDSPDIDQIAVATIPTEGLGEAINDRLRRAAADR
ncbi:L-threonylcarbamoyladenylate synthase [Aureimonas pseudogalii]|uniref:Threonylcarbamoyl-AMP synthase n=1 Tax=Aureimonas pseudogalii TaxID=1744844 RepID=A0A7W6EGV4_9HYPH|nr:L-threonylcarbamoyladenylate synthase [Aureimonas pseudogalii]MBB3998128.1 L-threonylcarbamoyladenylate synthase [Aureimonas pseudogalii]